MGELSKKIGEAGEDLVERHLKLIGWGNAQKKFDIRCIKPEKHSIPPSKARQTHGVDFLFSYASSLSDGILNNLVISVKFSKDEYPSSPGPTFRDHFKDLVQTIECFKKSTDRQSLISGKNGIRKVQDIGVLFWISNAETTYDDMLAKLSTVGVPDDSLYDMVYVADNRRITFVHEAIAFAKREYQNSEIDFYYFDTGKNINPLARCQAGGILPVEYINTSVLPLRVSLKSPDNKIMLLFSIDPFTEGGLRRLVGMANNLSGGWAGKIELCFPDYKHLEHENIVQRVKMSFEDKKSTDHLSVVSYSSDFRNIRK